MRNKDRVLIVAVVAIVLAVAFLRAGGGTPAPGASPGLAPTTGAHISTPLPRTVDIGAGACIPCREMAPILAELRSEYAGRAEVVFIDVWERPELARGYVFRAIPTQIFYDRHGREVWRHEGFLGKPEIVGWFRRLGVE